MTDLAAPQAGAPGLRPPRAAGHRDSWVPTWAMISSKSMELRKRRGLMIAVFILSAGIVILLNAIFLIVHVASPANFGPAGGLPRFQGFSQAFIDIFGICGILVGAAAGSTDLSDGVFRHLVATGRSRLALFAARVPAGLLIVIPMTAFAYAIEAFVAVLAAPPGANAVVGIQRFGDSSGGTTVSGLRAVYQSTTPSTHLMIVTGLWLMLQVVVAFVLGLGLGALTGSRSATVAILIAFQLVVTPVLSQVQIPHLLNLQRAFVGAAILQLEPSGLSMVSTSGSSQGPIISLPPMPAFGLAIVICSWVLGWLVIGAWRTVRRDA